MRISNMANKISRFQKKFCTKKLSKNRKPNLNYGKHKIILLSGCSAINDRLSARGWCEKVNKTPCGCVTLVSRVTYGESASGEENKC
jgi:hypothetical protein